MQRLVNDRRRFGLHVRQNVAVEIERDPDLAMTQALACDLGMDTGREQMRRMRVAQIMETNARQFLDCKYADPLMGDASRLQWAAVGLCYHKSIAIGPLADLKQFLCLLEMPSFQFIDNRLR